MKNVKLALRTLAKTPFVTAVAILSLALGIGANAAIYSLFDQILLRALPVQEPERLVNLANPGPKPGSTSCGQAGGCDEVFSYAMFRDLEAHDGSLSGVAAHVAIGVNLSLDGSTSNGLGMLVSGSYFPVLGLQPALGRLFTPADDQNPGEHSVVVLSHGYWENDLGADRSVLNRTLVVNGQPLTVVGVAPRGFKGTTLGADPDVFVPLTMRGAMLQGWQRFDDRRAYWAYVFGRLAPGVTLEQARADLNNVYSGIIREVEAPLQEEMSAATMERFLAKGLVLEEGERGQSSVHGEASTPLGMLFGITAMVLLIACANIANLLLARGAVRQQEMAIRGALGGGRARMLGQLMLESVILALAGGAASLVVADWTLGLLMRLLPPDATTFLDPSLSPGVIAFAGALALGTGFLFGLYPALHATRPDLVTSLKSATGQPSGARSAARLRSALVTAQIALSMALLMGAGLFIKSLVNVSRVELGLDTENVVTFAISPALNGYEPERSMELFQRTEQELAALPGVTGVTASLVPLLAGNSWGNSVSVEGFEWSPDVDVNSRFNEVGPGYFATMGMPLVAGREFTESDVEGASGVAVVNEAFARKFGLDPRGAVGAYMAQGSGRTDLDLQIVGVVTDAKYSDVKDAVPPLYFRPYRQGQGPQSLHFYVRTGLEPTQVMPAVREAVKRLDPNLPVEDLRTLASQIDENVFMDRFLSSLSAAFAILATLLAAVGLYGVLTFTVAQRTREIGLRMALGAGGGRVQGMVLRQVGRMTLVGGALGIVAALFLGKAMASLLYGMEGTDPLVVGAVAVALAAVALAAGYLPARRASRVDPMVALRYE